MKRTIGIRREDLNKTGEQRVALAPEHLNPYLKKGHRFLIQPARHPETQELKRALSDDDYQAVGAHVQEDLSEASLIFGLKEIGISHLEPEKSYLFFSHTHKGQVKNRKLLRELVAKRNTLIDYELIVNAQGQRLLTAFTYYAGYAGMIDSLWTLGKRYQGAGRSHPMQNIAQSVTQTNLAAAKDQVARVGQLIRKQGTPADLPPLITCFLGNGKTSYGAQEIYDLLPVVSIGKADLPEVFAHGNRNQVYKLVLDVPEMYRIKADANVAERPDNDQAFFDLYLREPEHFESDLEGVFPFCSLLMNCVIWSDRYPRLLTREDTKEWYATHPHLQVIGDISCDPEGAIEFSQETWIDQPVFVYDPAQGSSQLGFDGAGIAVMAVTNLPCEFPVDASRQFGTDMQPLLEDLLAADFEAESYDQAGLPEPIQKATILWQGKFTPDYAYMAAYL